jgi:hypothetical protein
MPSRSPPLLPIMRFERDSGGSVFRFPWESLSTSRFTSRLTEQNVEATCLRWLRPDVVVVSSIYDCLAASRSGCMILFLQPRLWHCPQVDTNERSNTNEP